MKQQNYYQPLRDLSDSHFPKQKFYAKIDDELLLVYEGHWYYLDTNQWPRLINSLHEMGITPKTLNNATDYILPVHKTDSSESFYDVINYKKILIYAESSSGNWYKQDFTLYDRQQTKELIGHLKENGVHEMDLFYCHCFF